MLQNIIDLEMYLKFLFLPRYFAGWADKIHGKTIPVGNVIL